LRCLGDGGDRPANVANRDDAVAAGVDWLAVVSLVEAVQAQVKFGERAQRLQQIRRSGDQAGVGFRFFLTVFAVALDLDGEPVFELFDASLPAGVRERVYGRTDVEPRSRRVLERVHTFW